MNTLKTIILASLILLIAACNQSNTNATSKEEITDQKREFYQLKTYTFNSNEQMLSTDRHLKEAFLPGLKRLGINNVGVFKPRTIEVDSIKKIILLIPFSSLSQFSSLENELTKDEVYMAAASDYLNSPHDNPNYLRIESTILRAFENMPFMKTPGFENPRSERVYELRSYESATEAYHNRKVDMFNEGGEINLFESLDFNAVFYGKVISGAKMPNLIYMITFQDLESRKAHWDAFVKSPGWSEMKDIPKYKNTVSHIDMNLLFPTDYSDY